MEQAAKASALFCLFIQVFFIGYCFRTIERLFIFVVQDQFRCVSLRREHINTQVTNAHVEKQLRFSQRNKFTLFNL